jgi:glycyl-tRNA synthetase beta chain
MSNRFLFELGTEEIPASMIQSALKQLKAAFDGLFVEHAVECDELSAYCTPRRLAIIGRGLPGRSPDKEDVVSGPPKSIAFGSDGQPSKAAEGFARKQGVAVEQLELLATDRGEYLALRRLVKGDPLSEILGRSIPGIIASVSWPKNMYWRESRFRFIRPLRWYVCLWNDTVIDFEFEGVRAGRTTRGHRLLGDAEIPVDDADHYLACLEENFVLADSAVRKSRIIEGLAGEAGDLQVKQDDELLETVVYLNEYPTVLRGDFEKSFLKIPEEVLVTVMRFHQKYFSLVDEEGRLASSFLTVTNTNGDPDGGIKRGHEKVLQARLEDAAFFWETDQKRPLKERVPHLEHVLFQERLGSYLKKTDRLRNICRGLGAGEDLETAALLCKADLTTDMVREFPELQGIMGGLYARQEGYPEAVWRAVYEHYRPVALDDALPETETGVLLSIADRIDTIVGCIGVDMLPSGSSDPFGLRRQAQGLVSLLLSSALEVPLAELIRMAQREFSSEKPDVEVFEEVKSFLEKRVNYIFQREGLSHDVLRAVMSGGITTVHDAFRRAAALAEIKGESDFEALAAAFKRTKNILNKFEGEIAPLERSRLVEQEEQELHSACEALQPKVKESVKKKDYETALRLIAGIRDTVDRFFDKVLVMDDDTALRNNRLALLQEISDLFLSIADISEVVQQGDQNGK